MKDDLSSNHLESPCYVGSQSLPINYIDYFVRMPVFSWKMEPPFDAEARYLVVH